MVVIPTVFSMHCSSATNVHLFLASGDDEVYHMSVSRMGIRTGGFVCILLFEHGIGHYQSELIMNRNLLCLKQEYCHDLFTHCKKRSPSC